MKSTFTTVSFIFCTLAIMAQTYTLELPITPSQEWNTNQWSGKETEQGLSLIAAEKNFFGVSKETLVNVSGKSAFKITRKGSKYVLEDEAGETRLVRLSSNYVMGDGVRLVRQPQNFNKKIRVLHPDGALLAEGVAENNTLSKYSLEIKILESSEYNTEILAMLSVDLIEQLRFQSAGIIVY